VVGSINLRDGVIDKWFSFFEADSALKFGADGRSAASPFVATAMDSRSHVLAAQGRRYRIVEFDSTGSVLRTYGRSDLEPTYPTDEDVRRHEESLKEISKRSGFPMSDAVAKVALEKYWELAKPFFSITAFAVDNRDRLWVIAAGGGANGSSIDLFDDSGRYLQALSVEDEALALAIRGSLVAVLVARQAGAYEDQRGVDIYRISETKDAGSPGSRDHAGP